VEEPIKIKGSVQIKGDELSVDFNGTSPASKKGVNVCLYYTLAYVTYALKATIASDIPNNEGSFRPISVTAPKGCILNDSLRLPYAASHNIGSCTPVGVMGVLYEEITNKILPEGATAIWSIQIYVETSKGSPFCYTYFSNGGMGARPT